MSLAHPKIVVAASDPREGRLISRHLRGHAYRVTRAGNSRDCFKALTSHFDCLLLDLSFQKSWKLLQHARNGNGYRIPVLTFDHARNALKELKAFHLGADGFVARPQIKEELLSVVALLVEKKGLERKYERIAAKERAKTKSLEQELKRIADYQEKISSNIPLSIIIVDQEKKVTYVNRNFCHAMGGDADQLLGRTLDGIFPETLYRPIELLEKAESVLREGRPTPRFSMAYRGDYYTYRLLPIRSRSTEGGHSRQVMILMENVSELKDLGERVKFSEEKYRTLFENSPDGILVTRPGGGRILEANRQAERLLERKRTRLKGRSFMAFFQSPARKAVKKRLLEMPSKGGCELPDLILPGQGRDRIFAPTVSAILHRGEPALLCILKDVTEKRFLEDQVRQTEKMSLLGQFTAGAAHEINNPLAIISSHAQYLLSEVNGGRIGRRKFREILDTLNLIDRESRYCGGIIQNLLAYTHTREAMKKPVDLREVVDNSLKMVAHQLRLSNVEVKSEIESDLPMVFGDSNLLQQVLMNLIWNAQAAMPKKGTLGIRTKRVDETGKEVEISVKDTGVGILKENLEKIFTPFFTTKEIGKGTGLGLWVVRSIIEEHKGTIGVKSQVGRGSTFRVCLPAIGETGKNENHSLH